MPVSESLLSAADKNDHAAIDMANSWSHSSFGKLGGNEVPGICMNMSGQRLLERAPDNTFLQILKHAMSLKMVNLLPNQSHHKP